MTLDVEGNEQLGALRNRLLKWATDAPKDLKQALGQASEIVRREIQEGHLSGPKMPRGVGDPDMATLAVQTGILRRSISKRISIGNGTAFGEYAGANAEIGTTVSYGRVHELGEGNMPERPFLSPSVRKMRPKIFEILRQTFFKGHEDAPSMGSMPRSYE